ncbi:MAG: PqqD family protein [Planctomycetota bacterium]
MSDFRHFEQNALPEFLRGEYSPPAVATLVVGRRRWFYERLETWSPPEGWEEGPSILDFPVYPSRRPGLTFRELGDSLVIHDPMTLDTHSLNETAGALFELCDGSRDFREVSEAYARRYGLEPAKAEADARRLLREFFEKKLLLARSERIRRGT